MAEVTEKTKIYPVTDFSKGIQRKTSRFQQADNEVNNAENITFDEIGGFGPKTGYSQEGSDLTSTTSTSSSTSTTTTSTSTSSSSSTSTSTTTTA